MIPKVASLQELLASSLIDENTMREIRDNSDFNTYAVSQENLLELLCPNGYRAHRNVSSARLA